MMQNEALFLRHKVLPISMLISVFYIRVMQSSAQMLVRRAC